MLGEGFGEISYVISVVVGNTYFIYTKMGVTLPVLKNEIKDFFFARLGTGGNYDPPLRFGECTERRYVYKWYGVFGFDIIYTHRCWWGCKLHGRDIWREDIVVPYVTTYAVTLRRRT